MIASKDLIGNEVAKSRNQFHIVYVCVCLYTFLKFASRLFLNGLKLLFFDLEVGDWFKSRNLSISQHFATFAER